MMEFKCNNFYASSAQKTGTVSELSNVLIILDKNNTKNQIHMLQMSIERRRKSNLIINIKSINANNKLIETKFSS